MQAIEEIREESARLATNARWLATLRWVAMVGQLATIAGVAWWLTVDLDLWLLLPALAVTALSNLAYEFWLAWQKRAEAPLPPDRWLTVIGGLMLLDLLTLTVMLWATGGPSNPFFVFYFVNVALAAVLLPGRWAWLACGVAIVASTSIFFSHEVIDELARPERLSPLTQNGSLPLATAGQMIAFATCTIVIVSFLTRLTSELRASEHRRRRAEQLRARSEKLEALGTLAAGAAHELATPLSTIAVVAGEMQRDIEQLGGSPEMIEDMQLVRGELDRCRAILDRMAIDSGQMIGEVPRQVTAQELCDEIVTPLPPSLAARIETHVATEAALSLPVIAASQALRGLVQNALDADELGPIQIDASNHNSELRLTITDRGPGMTKETLDRLGEPFFTTKQPGRGMGLGWFLARSVVERLGGEIDVTSTESQGTKVTVDLPTADANNKK